MKVSYSVCSVPRPDTGTCCHKCASLKTSVDGLKEWPPDVLVCHQAMLPPPDEILVSLLPHSALLRDGEAQGEGEGSLRSVASTAVLRKLRYAK